MNPKWTKTVTAGPALTANGAITMDFVEIGVAVSFWIERRDWPSYQERLELGDCEE